MFRVARVLARASSVARVRLVTAPTLVASQRRSLHIHEYQSQQLLKKHGVNVPRQGVAETVEEARKVAEVLGCEDLVVKAQILAGGRGLGTFDTGLKGGVHLCHSPEEVERLAGLMLGKRLVTKQTGPEGKVVSKVLIAERKYIRRELYLSIVLDRKACGPVLLASTKGGTDIETLAHDNPQAIIREPIDINVGLQPEQANRIAEKLGFSSRRMGAASQQLMKLYELFCSCDCTQLEINPLAETSEGDVMCVDAKLNFDDNAEFRQHDIFSFRDYSQEDPREVTAAQHDLNYIGLDGNIGCLVNGAGLAMASMDIIKLYGGNPANFLDVGGGASQKQVAEALKIIAADPNVRAILVNIFGGIMRCDVIALGIISAVESLKLNVPLVVRLQGTNVDAARQLIDASGLRIIAANHLDEAGERVVKVANIVSLARDARLNVSFELPL